MGQPTSVLALPDARHALNRAADSPNGIRISFPSKAKAHSFRMRCYTVRSRERTRMEKIYGPGTPSPWDAFMFQLDTNPDGTATLTIVNEGGVNLQIEEL